ncbi:hypothetical protein N7497_000997 [Penicillium chrysogenum]|nr:hypothetical protein N7497_000997 [Penicillium chrysogenum]
MFIFVIKYDVQKIFASAAYEVLETVASRRYTITRLLETHAQANHLTAASYLQHKLLSTNDLEVPIRIGRRVRPVQEVFAKKYGVPERRTRSAIRGDGKSLISEITAQVLHLPGHTPDHSGYVVGSNVFTGDSIFNPDVCSARCDLFPMAMLGSCTNPCGGSSDPGREPMAFVTVADQLEENKHIKTGTTEEDFVNWRENRDSGLKEPKLLHQAL